MADVTARRLDVLLYKRLAARKLASFRAFAELYPEYCWVFAGDNGQVGPQRRCGPFAVRVVRGSRRSGSRRCAGCDSCPLQGDMLVAEMLHKFLKTPGGQQQLLACFIHRVASIKDTVTRLRRWAVAAPALARAGACWLARAQGAQPTPSAEA